MRINLRIILYSLIVCITTSCEDFSPSPYPSISFQKTTSMPDAGRASAVAWSIGGKGYVALGRTKNGIQLKDCWQFDPADNTWTKMADYPDNDTVRVKAIAQVVNGKVYVGLGFDLRKQNGENNVKGNLRGLRSYDPITNSWSAPLAYFPSDASNACISFVRGNDIYVGSGFNGLGYSSEFWKYSTTENKWTRLNDLPFRQRSCPVVSADSSHIFFGTGYTCANLSDWWEYEPSTDSWTKKESIPDNGRTCGVGFSINHRYFIATGRHTGGEYTGGKILGDVLEYNPSKNTWYKRGSMPSGERENAICIIINDRVYIGTGENGIYEEYNSVLNDFWTFQP
jgi:N-acetylneuraminic acid mutarotase